MDGPVLSGGVIVLVSVLLWLLYFLPSWRGRHQYEAAERNAVRLNRALRVLAETSETPEEVRLELNARTALAQQRLAKRLQSEREAAELERLRQELAATRADPAFRQARARRRVRITTTALLSVGLATVGAGVWVQMTVGSATLLWIGGALTALALLTLQRIAVVSARAARRARRPAAPATVPALVQRERTAELHDQGPREWTPRTLPQPMVSVAGSRAHAAQATIDARTLAREAERAAELQRRAETLAPAAPAAIRDVANAPVAAEEAPAASSPYARMGFVDDAEIEAHVRQLLARRAAG
ncbi:MULTISPECIES: hypothetical protein [Microbacterium]|uniref:hypothetical protein n=1 Tax=Microbacterium TaxID=33882 RepID=UPI00300F8C22